MDYNDPKSGLSGTYSTYKRNKLTYDEVRKQLNTQNGYQINKQTTNDAYFPIWGRGQYQWQIDLMLPPSYNKIGLILSCINVNTRYAYAYAFSRKTQTLEHLEEWLRDAKKDKQNISYVQSDLGSEFNNRDVKQLFINNGIDFFMVQVADHSGQGKVERFNETLRRLINNYCTSNDTSDWVSVLDDLVYNYNHRYNRAIGCAPIEADEQTGLIVNMVKYKLAQNQFITYKVGAHVRILIDKNIFDKGRKQWTKEVYVIQKIEGHMIKVNDQWYKNYELLLVNGSDIPNKFEEDLKANKKEKKIVRTLNKEGVDRNDEVKHKILGLKVRGIPRGSGYVPQNGNVVREIHHDNEPISYWVEWDDGKGGTEITLRQAELSYNKR